MPTKQYFNRPNNIANHNLCKSTSNIPPGAMSLLGFGLNFCIKHRYPTNKIQKSIDRFTNDIRTKHLLAGAEDINDFIPQLYIKDPHWKAPPANTNIEQCLQRFSTRLQLEQTKYNRHCQPNMTCLQNNALRKLINHPKYIVLQADKNMGTVLMERDTVIKQIIKEHLGNASVYKKLTAAEANAAMIKLRRHARTNP
jgi:hypothetical protein